jgi:hypothetical protein
MPGKRDEAKWKRAKDAVSKSKGKAESAFTDRDWGLVPRMTRTEKHTLGACIPRGLAPRCEGEAVTCRGCGPSPDPEQDREHNDWCPDNPRAGWTIPASMLAPATPPDHYTLDQVRVMLRAAITHSWSTHLWSRTRPIEERIDTLLAMFTPKEKP